MRWHTSSTHHLAASAAPHLRRPCSLEVAVETNKPLPLREQKLPSSDMLTGGSSAPVHCKVRVVFARPQRGVTGGNLERAAFSSTFEEKSLNAGWQSPENASGASSSSECTPSTSWAVTGRKPSRSFLAVSMPASCLCSWVFSDSAACLIGQELFPVVTQDPRKVATPFLDVTSYLTNLGTDQLLNAVFAALGHLPHDLLHPLRPGSLKLGRVQRIMVGDLFEKVLRLLPSSPRKQFQKVPFLRDEFGPLDLFHCALSLGHFAQRAPSPLSLQHPVVRMSLNTRFSCSISMLSSSPACFTTRLTNGCAA